MGSLNFDEDKEIAEFIIRRLKRRGLKPDFDGDWEVHGPHPGMDYQVCIGYVYDKTGERFCVAIYPRAVYQIIESFDWWKVEPEDRILIKKKSLKL